MNKQLLLLVLIGSMMLVISGCVRTFCCGIPTYIYTCSNYADSTSVSFTLQGFGKSLQNQLTDSLQYYRQKGFTCHGGGGVMGHCVIGLINRDEARMGGDTCFTGNYTTECAPGVYCGD